MQPKGQSNPDIICAGMLVADIFVNPIPRVPPPGQLELTDRLLLAVGGCASNTAVSLSRLGHQVTVLGKVGNDLFGDFVLKDFQRLGPDPSRLLRSQSYPTSTTVVINVEGEDRRFIHSFGANAEFSAADIDVSQFDAARALYVGGFLAMPKLTAQDLKQVFRAAKERSVLTILDVVIPAGQSLPRDLLKALLAFTDAFLPNDDEAFALTGLMDPVAQARALSEMNPQCTIVITMGRRGALACRKGEIIRAGIYPVNVVDPSGAGDAFDAGLIAGMLEGWPLEKTLSFASAVGASCTRALGCTAGVFNFDEASSFVATHSLNIEHVRG